MREEKIYYSDSGELFYDAEEAEINDSMAELKKKQAEILAEMYEIQDCCDHRHMTVHAHSDTGNYSRSDDEYWYEGNCRACGKTFRADQSENSILRDRYNKADPRVITKK